ncbi:MAG: YceI family protein [Gammaproteobacteria bacterium]|nr:YceI family protein [Gammaproteobacteria bacterium]MDD9959120.1 YceI family protein [Gammaproteobacteria bacterium]
MPYSILSIIKISSTLLLGNLLLISNSSADPADWEIDPEHFSIVFEATHIEYQSQIGFFLEASGNFRYDPETQELFSGNVEIQADSIFTNHEDRDDHLRSRDFLSVRRNPVIAFTATGYSPAENAAEAGILNGNLSMLGQNHPVVLEVVINKRERYPFGHRKETLGISAQAVLLRSQWGMDYGVSNSMVGDEVTLRFEFEALRQ